MEIKYLSDSYEKIAKSSDLEFGKNVIPLTAENNLLSNAPLLNEKGYGLFALPDYKTFDRLNKYITRYVLERFMEYQKPIPSHFTLSDYHGWLESEDVHYKISTWALDYKMLGDVYYEILHQAEEMLQLKLKVKKINHLGIDGEYIGFRILRPLKNDHNPFHRDAWIPYWRNAVNIWLPICGFEDGNTLQLIPKSHLWNDDEILKTKAGVELEGKKYHVPAAIGTVNKFSIETPVLQQGEGIIFSPYLVHGNGVNRKKDVTRVSLEFRFCKA
jgi:hypothetical protein